MTLVTFSAPLGEGAVAERRLEEFLQRCKTPSTANAVPSLTEEGKKVRLCTMRVVVGADPYRVSA